MLYVNKVSPIFGGGAELRIREIGKRLVKRGHEAYVICAKTEPNLPDYENVEGIKVYYVKTIPEFLFRFKKISFYLSRYMFYFLSIMKLYKVAKKVDIIIDDIAPAPSFAYIIAIILNKPCYATIHEFFGLKWFKLKDPITASFGFFSQYLLKIFIFKKIITVSEFTKSRLIDFGIPKERIIVIPNGIDVSKYLYKKGILKEKNSIVTLGRLVKQKGHIYLIDAMREVVKKVQDAKLYIIGDGPLINKLKQHVRECGLEKNIIFMGKESEKEKIKRLYMSELFALSSLQEGFGIVLLESMACGLPIIASNLSVFREFLNNGKNGYLVEKANSKKFAEMIVELLGNDEKRNRIGRYNQEYVKRFDWDKVAEMEEEVLMG